MGRVRYPADPPGVGSLIAVPDRVRHSEAEKWDSLSIFSGFGRILSYFILGSSYGGSGSVDNLPEFEFVKFFLLSFQRLIILI